MAGIYVLQRCLGSQANTTKSFPQLTCGFGVAYKNAAIMLGLKYSFGIYTELIFL